MDSLVKTQVVRLNLDEPINDELLQGAVQLILSGEVVAFPTETVYGLGANALDISASMKIFKIKNRPCDNPLIVHISDLDMLKPLVSSISELAKKLIDAFWPGPLTILFPKSQLIPDIVSAGHPTVAIRMPSHPLANRFIFLCKTPIAAPSANLSGKPSPTTAAHVLEDLDGRVQCIIDTGPSSIGLESTVIDINRAVPLILRPGGVSIEKIREIIPNIQLYGQDGLDSNLESKPPTPGLKYRHYSPNAQFIVYEGKAELVEKEIGSEIKRTLAMGKKVGLIQTLDKLNLEKVLWPKIQLLHLGNEKQLDKIAHGFFSGLRELDLLGVDVILMQGVPEHDEGVAIMNRAKKAASHIVQIT